MEAGVGFVVKLVSSMEVVRIDEFWFLLLINL